MPLTTIFDEAGLQAEATEITFYAMDTYKKTLPLDGLLREGVFLAYEVNGETIPLDHGYPAAAGSKVGIRLGLGKVDRTDRD